MDSAMLQLERIERSKGIGVEEEMLSRHEMILKFKAPIFPSPNTRLRFCFCVLHVS